MDHQGIDEHLVTVAMINGENTIIERAPINPIVYLEPPVLWLSGSLGMVRLILGIKFEINQCYNFLGIKSEINHLR